MVKLVPKTHLMTEEEWRSIGVQQSKGWIHYMTHQPGSLLTAVCVLPFLFLYFSSFIYFVSVFFPYFCKYFVLVFTLYTIKEVLFHLLFSKL
jgi:hypothetical protein